MDIDETPLEMPNKFEPQSFSHQAKKVWQNPSLTIELTRNFEESIVLFKNLKDVKDVANFLELPVGQLQYILYELKDRYSIFKIPKKKGGERELQQPCSSLMILQRKLKPFIEHVYRVKKPVHGFVSSETLSKKTKKTIKKGIQSNAEQHAKKRYVLNVDLENFFQTVNFGRVRGVFISKPFLLGQNAATILAQICTYNNILPQGAPTSPIISNLVSANLDTLLVKLAKDFQLTYSRYADDLTFSSNRIIPSQIVIQLVSDEGKVTHKVGKLLELKINNAGFNLNHSKTRLQHKSQRQEVTGLVVNDGVNVNRKFIRDTRAMIHSLAKDVAEADKKYLMKRYGRKEEDIDISKLDGSSVKKAIYGRLGFIEMIRGSDFSPYLTFCEKMLEIDQAAAPKRIIKLKEVFDMYDVFICHASEDKDLIAMPIHDVLKDEGFDVFIDNIKIGWGDSLVEKINTALKKSKYVLAIISDNSMNKAWPMKELHSVLSSEISHKETRLLPLFVGDEKKILEELPLLSDKLFKKYDNNPDEIARGLIDKLRS